MGIDAMNAEQVKAPSVPKVTGKQVSFTLKVDNSAKLGDILSVIENSFGEVVSISVTPSYDYGY